MNAVLALFRFTVRQTLLSRKVILAVMMLCGPSAIALLVRMFAPEDNVHGPSIWERYHFLLLYMMLGGVAPLVCMVYGPALVGSEVESGTIVYHFTRRMHRATVVIARFLGTAFAITVLLDAAIVVCHLISVVGLPKDRIAENWLVGSPGGDLACYLLLSPVVVCAFLSVFTMLNLLTRSLVASGVYFVVVEMVIANIPAKVQIYSITHHMRKTMEAMLPQLNEMPLAPKEMLYPAGESGWLVLVIIVVVVTGFCAAFVSHYELMPERAKRE